MDLETHAFVARLQGLYAIVNEGLPDPVELTRAILAGGARIVQYRAKSGIVADHARALRQLTCEQGALFILNDDWRAVRLYDADGVHVGPEDAQPSELSQIRSELRGRILGVSCGKADEAIAAQNAGADYVGVGSVYLTGSKADAGDPIGIEGLEDVVRATTLPVAAIGGITRDAIAQIRSSGAAMAAVISAISGAPDPQRATAALVAAWDSA